MSKSKLATLVGVLVIVLGVGGYFGYKKLIPSVHSDKLENSKTFVEILTGAGTIIGGAFFLIEFRRKIDREHADRERQHKEERDARKRQHKAQQRQHAQQVILLYEKFYEQNHLKGVREALDSDRLTEAQQDAMTESMQFGDYLNFFDVVLMLVKKRQLTRDEAESVFGYDLERLCRWWKIRAYIRTPKMGFGSVDAELNRLAAKNDWFVATQAQPDPP